MWSDNPHPLGDMKRLAATTTLIGLCTTLPAAAEVLTETVVDSGARSWVLRDGPLELRLQQLTLDQIRAFYLGRGFDAAEAERIAHGCVFQTVARNIGTAGSIALNLAHWRLETAGGPRPIKLKREWNQEFQARGTPPSARIAFRWATFPTEQSFDPSDYNWGMTTFGLPPGTRFDLALQWWVDGQPQQTLIKSMSCAEETEPP